MERMGRQGIGHKQLLDNLKEMGRILEVERGSMRFHFVENLLRRDYGLSQDRLHNDDI